MKWIFWIYIGLYLCALALFAVSALGLFGQQKDPLGGVFLLPLGLPWNVLFDRLGVSSTAAFLIAPGINVAILGAIWKLRR